VDKPGAAKLMQLTRVSNDDPAYPTALRVCLEGALPAVTLLGNHALLGHPALAFFCSVRCPGSLILQTYDLARALRDAGVPVIGGFHSPMEKECLALLLRGTQPVLICPARGIDSMRLPSGWKKPLADGRLLVFSPFPEKTRRVTKETAQTRNAFVAALAAQVFVAHAELGSKTERFCRELVGRSKPLWTLDSNENAGVIALGAKPLGPEQVSRHWNNTDR
jgi:predicted Rossmann fold nucleotide-binding protein DprA/Smf involved in DNA uptake